MRRLILLLVVAVLAALATAPAAGAARAARVGLGVMDPTYQSERPGWFRADVDALRPSVLRYDVAWDLIAPTRPAEPRDPGDPAYRWSWLDRLVEEAAEMGYAERMLFTIWRTPGWACASDTCGSGRSYANAPVPGYLADFAHAVARRYSGRFDPDGDGPRASLPRVRHYEILNEPNYAGGLRRAKGVPVSGVRYARLLIPAYRAVKAVNRRNVVLGGALFRSTITTSIGPVRFLREMRRGGVRLGRGLDVLSVHPYPAIPRRGINEGHARSGPHAYPNLVVIGNLGRFRKDVDRLLGKRTRIWITEIGWQTPAAGVRDRTTVTPGQQARFLRATMKRLRGTPRLKVDHVVWFLIRDEPPVNAHGRGMTWQSGLRGLDGKRKPAFRAFVRVVRGR